MQAGPNDGSRRREDTEASAAEPPELHIEMAGEGPVIVLAHGFAGSARNFRPQARALKDAYRVVTYDARGHARSGAPTDASCYRIDALMGDMGRVLDAADAPAGIIGGLSMGAAVALHFALAQPQRVRGLILASLPGGCDAPGSVSHTATAFADAIDRDGLEAAGEQFVWAERSGLPAAAASWVRKGFLEHPPHGLSHTLRETLAQLRGPEGLAEQLAGLAVPVLLVAGERDAPSVAASRQLAARLRDAEQVEIPNAGHVVNLEASRAFNASLRDWLAVHLPRAPDAPI